MGRRKERRLAAKIGAGRRVKLDLFAEPDGGLGASSATDEVERDVDAKHNPELPNSPSSGQQTENPLSLLGQYSDDELDDVSNKTADNSNDNKKAEGSIDESLEEGEVSGSEDFSSQKADKQVPERDSASVTTSQIVEVDAVMTNMVSLDEKHHEANQENPDTVAFSSDTPATVGWNSNWKMVLHEESSRYYYWNTVTGETSWEVPNGLIEGATLTNGLDSVGRGMEETSTGDVNNTIAFGVKENLSASEGYTNSIPEVEVAYEQAVQQTQSVEQSKADGNQLLGSSSVVGVAPCETSNLGNYLLPDQFNGCVGSSTAVSYEVYGHSAMSSEQCAVDPLHLMKRSEALLGRLQLLQRPSIDSDQHVWLSKHISEVGVRFSDIRALLPYGSSLAPFWIHSEIQLNQLEQSINAATGKQNIDTCETDLNATEGKEAKVEDRVKEVEVGADMTKSSPKICTAPHNIDSCTATHRSSDERVTEVCSLNVPEMLVSGAITHLALGEESGKVTGDTVTPGKANSMPEIQSDEDMDMDVDMEVEVPSPTRNRTVDTGGKTAALPEPYFQPSASVASQPPVPENELVIPPPPDEEWIPPPPPDDESIPPPPPDEPPEPYPPAPPPSDPEPVQPIYVDNYSVNYSDSNMNYYGNPIAVTSGSTLYTHTDGTQMASLSLPVYYATDPNIQPIAVPNPADAYYGFQNGVEPLTNTIGSSSFQPVFGNVNHNSLSSTQIASTNASVEACSLSNQFVEIIAPSAKTDKVFGQVSSASEVSALATVSAKEHVSVPSFISAASSAGGSSASAAVPDTSVPISKSKASRMKKPKISVASSMRSNKKVSSLVDKWKAAKEELQEEEEERETPLDILEKKRQREIEEWRAQQIATGEAKENANFQPLGGDWRERVKRRRAQKEASVEKTSDAAADGNKQQSDLDALSKDLPPGWQAYWDDSSKQIYYANSVTSETTWTKPTR